MMEASRLVTILLLLLLMNALMLVRCDDEDADHLLQGTNSFRQASNVPVLAKHEKAKCVADALADKLEDTQCASNTNLTQAVANYPDILKKCDVSANATRDGVVLPVCVPNRVETLVLTNYTESSQNARYLNNSRFTDAGIGTEDDWTVLVLTTNTPGGNFVSSTTTMMNIGLLTCYCCCLSSFLLLGGCN